MTAGIDLRYASGRFDRDDMFTPRRRRLAAIYLGLQAAAVPVWWALLAQLPGARGLFLRDDSIPPELLAFALPDLALLAVASAISAAFVARGSPRAGAALWTLLGALGYATLYTAAWVLLGRGTLLCAVLMGAATLGSALVLRAVV